MDDLPALADGYLGLWLLCATSGLLVPVPEDVALLYAGRRVYAGELAWAPTLAVAMSGVMLRDLGAYTLGRLLGEGLLSSRWVDRLWGRGIAKARARVRAHGSAAVLGGRFLIGARSAVFVVSGAAGIPLGSFVAWNALGMVVAVPGMVLLGHLVAGPLLEGELHQLMRLRAAGVGLTVLVLAVVGWRWARSGS